MPVKFGRSQVFISLLAFFFSELRSSAGHVVATSSSLRLIPFGKIDLSRLGHFGSRVDEEGFCLADTYFSTEILCLKTRQYSDEQCIDRRQKGA